MLEILNYGAFGFSNSLAVNPGPMGRKLLASLSCYPHWWVRIKSLEGPHRECGHRLSFVPRGEPQVSISCGSCIFCVSEHAFMPGSKPQSSIKLGVCLGVCSGWCGRDRQEGSVPRLTHAGLSLQEQFMFRVLGSGRGAGPVSCKVRVW